MRYLNKIFTFFVVTSVLSILLILPQKAHAQEYIEKMNVDVVVQQDGYVEVNEEIMYDFASLSRHGIFRDIPVRYTLETEEGEGEFLLDINVTSVTDEDGNKYMFEVSNSNGNVRIKIGDPDVEVTGKHTYVISYLVDGALREYTDHDELYLDVIGGEWDVPINQAEIRIYGPYNEDEEGAYRTTCFVGRYGSTTECNEARSSTAIAAYSVTNIQPGESVSIVQAFPKRVINVRELIPYVPFEETLLGKIVGFGIVTGALLWFIILPVWIAWRWFKYGRDPYIGYAPTAHFDPPKTMDGRELTPAETGVLIDEKVHKRDVLSSIVDLARRGHLKIVEKKKGDFYFEKNKDSKEPLNDLPGFEVLLLSKMFKDSDSVHLKKTKLATAVQKVEKKLYKEMEANKFFPHNPNSIRTRYLVLGIAALGTFNLPLAFSAFVFGRNMPRKTQYGAREAIKAKGLYNFLKSQEKQLEFQADKQMMFEKLLPYAIAFGVEEIWMDRFKDIQLEQPEWYVSNRPFTHANFAKSFNSSVSNFNTAARPASSSSGFSSGGGFSGGGVGGGGGGSW